MIRLEKRLWFLPLLLLAVVLLSMPTARATLPEQWEQLRFDAADKPQETLAELNKLIDDYAESKRYFDLAHAYIIQAEALRSKGLEPDSFAAVETGLQYARVSEASYAEAALRLIAVQHHLLRSDIKAARAEQELAERAAKKINHQDLLIEVALADASIKAEQGQLVDALTITNHLESNYHSSNPRLAYEFHASVGEFNRRLGEYDIAISEMTEALELAEQKLGRWHASVQHYNLGLTQEAVGETRKARHHYEASLAIGNELGDDVGIGYAAQAIGLINFYTGDYAAAMRRYQQALPLFIRSDIPLMEAWMRLGIAELLVYQGEVESAKEWLATANDVLASLDDLDIKAHNAYLKAQIATAEGNDEGAMTFYQEYAQLYREGEVQRAEDAMNSQLVQAQERELATREKLAQVQDQLLQLSQQNALTWRWLLASLMIGGLLIILMVIHYLRRRSQLNQQYAKLNQQDQLTGLPNRTESIKAAKAILTAALIEKRPLIVVMLSLNKLHQINDELGLDTGDKLLQSLVRSCPLKASRRSVFGRISGNRFILALSSNDMLNTDEVVTLLEQWQAKLKAASTTPESSVYPMSFSAGIGVLDLEGESFQNLHKRTEEALANALAQGPATIVIAPQPKPL